MVHGTWPCRHSLQAGCDYVVGRAQPIVSGAWHVGGWTEYNTTLTLHAYNHGVFVGSQSYPLAPGAHSYSRSRRMGRDYAGDLRLQGQPAESGHLQSLERDTPIVELPVASHLVTRSAVLRRMGGAQVSTASPRFFVSDHKLGRAALTSSTAALGSPTSMISSS